MEAERHWLESFFVFAISPLSASRSGIRAKCEGRPPNICDCLDLLCIREKISLDIAFQPPGRSGF
jgi:hypothetical protein